MTISDLRVLVDNLDEYIHISGGIERLKKTVLHLAMSGQLVKQNPSDGTSNQLYEQIQSVHKPKKTPPQIEDAPFEIPDSWMWVNLGNIIELKSGADLTPDQYNDAGNGVPYITGASNIENERVTISRWTTVPKNIAEKDDLLITCKGTIGTMAFLEIQKAHIARQIMAIKFNEYLQPRFIQLAISTNINALKDAAQSIIPGIARNDVLSMPITLPPLVEQKRIVQRVDEIFALIDELSNKYQAEEEERRKFVKSSLRTLAYDKSTLALDNLSNIIKTKADAAELRKAILHLAVSGQLVSQNHTEGTGEELFKKIQSQYKPKKPLLKIDEKEVPFSIPNNWRWTRLGELFDITSSKRVMQSDWKSSGVPFLRARDLTNAIKTGRIESDIFVSEKYYQEVSMSSGVPTPGDIMVSGVGTIGTPYSVKEGDKFYFKDATILWFRNPAEVFVDYVEMVFHSGFMKAIIKGQSQGTTVATYTIANARMNTIPLPPLDEQKRIVEKATELLDLVDELENYLEK